MKTLVWTLFFVVVLNGGSLAQTVQPASPKPPAKPIDKSEAPDFTPQQRRAIALLDSLVKDTMMFDNQPLGIKMQAKIADALWNFNQARAREIFTDAFQATGEIKLPEIQNKSAGLISDQTLSAIFSERAKLRQEVLQFVVVRDAELAEKMRASVAEKAAGTQASTKEQQDIQTVQTLELARSLAKSEPQKAAQLVRQIVASQYNPNIGWVLAEMRIEHSDLANTLFLETLAVMQKSSGSLGATAGSLSFYLTSERDRVIGNDPMTDPTRIPVIQPFLSTVLAIISRHVAIESEGTPAVQANEAAFDYIVLQQVTPFFARFMPDAIPTVRLRAAQLTKYLSNGRAEAIDKGMAKPAYEAIVKEAETATDLRRKDALYRQAASEAASQDKPDEAIRLSDKINDREARMMAGSVTRFQLATKAVGKNEMDDALRYAKGIEFSPQRVLIYKQMAEKFIAKKDYQRATELLSEIERWLEASAEDAKKVQGLLIVAGLVSGFDPPRGFEVTKFAVKAINNTDFKPPANKMEVHIKVESLDFASSFATLARTDFERALLIAQAMQKKEAAVIAQVEICKTALVGLPIRKS